MGRHELPSGGWVELRDDVMLRAKDQKKILRGLRSQLVTPGMLADAQAGQAPTINLDAAMDVGLSAADGVIALLLTDWKLPYAPDPGEDGSPREWVLPTEDPTIVNELAMSDYNELCRLVKPAMDQAFPTAPDPTDYKDLDSPTGPANGSVSGSRATL